MSVSHLQRRSFLAGLAAVASVPVAGVQASQAAVLGDGGLWRGLDLQDQTGRSFQLGRAGAPAAPLTLIKLWANWCPVCLSEITSLVALSAALGPQLDVVLVSHPEYWAQDLLAAQRRRLPFRLATPTAANNPEVVRAALTDHGAYAVPRSLVFRGRDAAVAWNHLGPMDWAAAGTASMIRTLAG